MIAATLAHIDDFLIRLFTEITMSLRFYFGVTFDTYSDGGSVYKSR